MSEEVIAQLEADEQILALGLPEDELKDLAGLTEELHSCRLFRRLSLPDLAYIAHAGTVRPVERGEVLIAQGDTDRMMYVVLEGQLRVWELNEQGKRQLLGYHYPGDYTGEMIMLTGDKRIATVDAVEDSKVVAFGEEGWKRISANQSLVNMIQRDGPERVEENTYPFDGKQLDEVIVERARRSWVALMRRTLAPILLGLISLPLSIWLSSQGRIARGAAISLGLLMWLFVFVWCLWMWQDWRNDDYIVTSKRIVRVERILIPPFPIERREVAIQAIQDIRTTNQGIWTLLFGIQSLEIRTMGSGTVLFPDLRNAEEVRQKIFETQKRAKARTDVPGHKLIRQRLAEELGYEVKQVAPLDSEPVNGVRKRKRPKLGPLEYFVPYTRVEGSEGITWRKHWLYMLGQVFVPALLILLSLALIVLPVALELPWVQGYRWVWTVPGWVLLLISVGWYLWQYEGWRNDVYCVTDSRIIDIEGSPFHLRQETRTEGMFDVIQNVTYDSPNLILRALGIGFVTIDTAAEEGAYTFDWVSNPAQVQQEIFTRWTAYREREKEAATRRQQQEFLDWIVQYDRLVRQEE